MAISNLTVNISASRRPWFRVAICTCYLLHKARIIRSEAATKFLFNYCITLRVERARPGVAE